MIVRRYGAVAGEVTPDFNAVALTEIGFARRPGFSMPWAEFEDHHVRVGEVLLSAASEGPVQVEAEEELLHRLRARVQEAVSSLGPGELLLVENVPGQDYPRTHERQENRIVDGENRLYFYYRVDPPLRLGVFRRRD